jgi:hypothetical protein
VERLRARFALDASLPSMRAVGYRQVWDTLEGKGQRGEPRGARHRRDAPARQAPAHVAAVDAGAGALRLPARGPRAGSGAAGRELPYSSPWYLNETLSLAR